MMTRIDEDASSEEGRIISVTLKLKNALKCATNLEVRLIAGEIILNTKNVISFNCTVTMGMHSYWVHFQSLFGHSAMNDGTRKSLSPHGSLVSAK